MSLRVLAIASDTIARYRERWNNIGIRSVRTSFEQAMSLIEAPGTVDVTFDAVVICCVDLPEEDWDTSTVGMPIDALSLAERIRSLPLNIAMYDGKQWRTIPILVLCSPRVQRVAHDAFGAGSSLQLSIVELVEASDESDFGAHEIKKAVVDYRFEVLSEFDDMGFIIRIERGRYMVGPALKPRDELAGKYYFGAADQRPRGFTTIHKDNFAVQQEVEEFEALINRADISEGELQQFFETHPHFLSETHTPLSHVRLPTADGGVLIPDFILKPIFAQRSDSRWEVVDLKLPNVKLLAGKGSRRRLSSKVMDAIAQLRDYKDNLEKSDAQQVSRLLGHPLKRPKLGVLIGRLANTDSEALDRAQQDFANVRIVTYDEILERQQTQLEFQRG